MDTAGDAPRHERPIVIFGAPRSGTSLLSRLLNSHSRIAIPFESHLFNQWLGRVPRYGDLARRDNQRQLIADIIAFGMIQEWQPQPDPDTVLARVEGDGFPAIARAFMDWAAATQGKPRWGEKTPHHTLLHREVLAAWSDALVVAIERDPRDVALSWKRARFGGNHVLRFAEAWTRYAAACEEVRLSLPADSVFSLRYESLVSAPQRTLSSLMAFLGEEFEPGQLAFHRSGEAWNTDRRNRENLRTPISSRSVGQWQSGLSAREVRLIETVAQDAMRRRGYPLHHPRAVSSVEVALARWIGVPTQRIVGLAKNAQGFVYAGRDIAWHLRTLAGR